MDVCVEEWEAVANSVLSDSRPDVRRKAEEKIHQLRTHPQPYELCYAILTRSSNDFLLYEAGRCLSHAVVKEWDTVFAPTIHDNEHCRANELLTFILGWAEQRGPHISAAPRQRVLGVAGALVKRAASAVAAQVVTDVSRTTDSSKETSARAKLDAIYRRLESPSSSPSDEHTASCDLVLRLLDHIESLIRPFIEHDWDQMSSHEKEIAVHRCLLGMCLLSAVLDEWSFTDDSTQAELNLATHRMLECRFQNNELLRLFCLLLHLANRLVNLWAGIESLNAVQNDLVFRLVCCLDSVFSWNYRPSEGFYMYPRRNRSPKTSFQPSLKWSVVLGPESLPSTLLVLIKLHMLVRSSSMLGTRTMSFFTRLSAISGPLARPTTQNSDSSKSHLYFLITIAYLTGWLVEGTDDDRSLTESSVLLASLSSDKRDLVGAELSKLLASHLVDRIPSLPISQLQPYEMCILAEVFEYIALRMSALWDRVETALEAPAMLDHPRYTQLVYLPALVSLAVIDRFFNRSASLLLQCFNFTVQDNSDSEQPISEAVERLSCNWIHLLQCIPFSDPTCNGRDSDEVGDHSAIPLTARGMEQQENETHHIRQLIHLLNSTVGQYRTRIFHSFLLCKLSPPDGTRRSSGDADEEVIDLELDTDDLYSAENSLFACAACGLAAPNQSCAMLLQLVNDRVTRLIQSHSQSSVSPAVLDLYEDVHWTLLITGHFIVSGPSSLGSVSKADTWGSEFSIPEELGRAIEPNSVNREACAQFLHLVVDRCPDPQDTWPPPGVHCSAVPTIIQLFASLHRLFWFQAEHHVGSAQLMEDNLWLMSRLALAYFCLAVRDGDTILDAKSTAPLLSIFHSDCGNSPEPAHQRSRADALPGGPHQKHSLVLRACLQGLISCALITLNKWSCEPKVVASTVCLIRIVARYIPNAYLHLACPAWYELCSMLCNLDSLGLGRPLASESLTELVEACLFGTWLLEKDHPFGSKQSWDASSPDDPLVLQLLHNFRHRVSFVFGRFTDSNRSNVVSSSDIEALVRAMAIVRGLARFAGYAVARFRSVMDLVSFLLTGVLFPSMEASVNTLLTKFENCPEITSCVLNLFSEVNETCFVYLASVPSSGTTEEQSPSSEPSPSDAMHYHVTGSSSCSLFLNLVLKLFRNFAKHRIAHSSSEPSAEEDRVSHLLSLLTTLNRLAGDEFELRMSEMVDATCSPRSVDLSNNPIVRYTIQSIDVVAVCLGHLLPLISESLLMVPDLCDTFFHVISNACDLHVDSFALLGDSQLQYLGRLLRQGIFGSLATVLVSSGGSGPFAGTSSVTLRSLEVLKVIAGYCLDARDKSSSSAGSSGRLEAANRLSTMVGLDMQLLVDLFGFVLKDTFTTGLESLLGLTIFYLIHMNPDGYADLVSQWLSSCPDPDARNQLQTAFERLGQASDQDHPPNDDRAPRARMVACFTELKPTFSAGADFQRRFSEFVSDVRSFACHT